MKKARKILSESGLVECRFCKELIKKGAIKCRFCGERLDIASGSHTNLRSVFFNTFGGWTLTVILFYLSLTVVKFDFSTSSLGTYLLLPVVVDVLVGIYLFFDALINSVRLLLQKRWLGIARILTMLILSTLLFYLLYNPIDFLGGGSNFIDSSNPNSYPRTQQVDVSTLTTTPSSTPTRTITKATTTGAYVPKYDGTRTGRIVDYYSYCEKKTIKIYENELQPYTTKAGKQIYSTKTDIQCYEKEYNSYGSQNTQQPSTQTTASSNKVPVYLTYYKYTTYCPQQNVSAVQAIDADIAKLAPKAIQDANTCEANFKKNDSCWQNCNSTSTADWSKCSYGSPEYQLCRDAEDAKYTACIQKCPNPSDSCKWAWSEINNLSSQINNLCK